MSGKTKKQPRMGGPFWTVLRLCWSFLFGLLLTLFVLGVLPYLQIVTGGGQKKLLVRDASGITEAPPPPEMQQEDEPPPPEPDEPPPEMQPQSMDISLSDLSASLNPGGGGAGILNPAVGAGAMAGAMAGFGSMDLDQKPRATYQEQPRIPSAARRQNLSGKVEIEFTVDAQGRVQNPRVVSSFNPLLNEPCIEAIKKWRFEPGTRGGKKVASKTKIPFKFGS
jgi:protein TonB